MSHAPITAYRLRRAVPDDAAAIARVHIASWRSTYTGLIPAAVVAKRTAWSVRYPLWVGRLAGDRAVFVVEDDDGIFGFACASRMPERPQEYEPLAFDAYLDALYLHARGQRHGGGRALLAAVADDCIARGLRSLALHVLSTSPSRAFYEHLGARFIRDEPTDGEAYFSCAYAFDDVTILAGRSPAAARQTFGPRLVPDWEG